MNNLLWIVTFILGTVTFAGVFLKCEITYFGCGGTVLGYGLVAVESLEGNKIRKTKLTINEKEAEIVRFIFNEYGNGYKAITNQLNKLGYKTKKGNNFSEGSIKDIITNPVYIGKVRYNVRQN